MPTTCPALKQDEAIRLQPFSVFVCADILTPYMWSGGANLTALLAVFSGHKRRQSIAMPEVPPAGAQSAGGAQKGIRR